MNRSLSALGLIATVAIVAPAFAAPTNNVRFGNTIVRLESGFLGAISSLGIATSSVTPATVTTDVRGNVLATFPISNGVIDLGTGKAEISHLGGLRFAKGSTVAEITDFRIDSTVAQPVITGLVTVNDSLVGRIPVFRLQGSVNYPLVPQNGFQLTVTGIELSLTSEAASALNSVFGVTDLAAGVPVGVAVTSTLVFE
ncbi:MAG: hypothetical protein SFU56_00125 [Capsulimonadales bacterium]|nr:hypothetical protein [Capsulimonadales bacterium]